MSTSLQMALVPHTGTRRPSRHNARNVACFRRTIVDLAICTGGRREVDGNAAPSPGHVAISQMALAPSLLRTDAVPAERC